MGLRVNTQILHKKRMQGHNLKAKTKLETHTLLSLLPAARPLKPTFSINFYACITLLYKTPVAAAEQGKAFATFPDSSL